MILNFLSLLFSLLPLIIFSITVLFLSIASPRFFILLILLYFSLTSSAFLFNFSFEVAISSFSIYPTDIFLIASILAPLLRQKTEIGIIDKVKYKSWNSMRVLLTIQTLLTFGGLVSWSIVYGIEIGVNAWRRFLLQFAVLNYLIRSRVAFNEKNIKLIFLVPGLILSTLVYFRFATSGIGRARSVDIENGEMLGRAASALGAYMILISLIAALFYLKDRLTLRMILLLVLVTELILLQHRTIWITVIGIFVTFFFGLKYFSVGTKVMLLFFSVPAVLGVWYISQRISFLLVAGSDTATYNWRVERWTKSMSTERSLPQWFFGSTGGPTPVTTYGLRTEVSHSAYIDQVEYFGFFGVFLFFLFFFYFYRFIKDSVELGHVGLLLLVSLLVYGYTYSLPVVGYLYLGTILSMCAGLQEDQFNYKLLQEQDNAIRKKKT